MPQSTDILICDELCELIHAELESLTPKRVHIPSWNAAKELKTPRIELNPGSQPSEQESTDYDNIAVEWPIMLTFAVTVAQANNEGNASLIDAHLDQVEELRKFVQSREIDLENGQSVHCQNFEYMTRMDPELIQRSGDTYTGTFLSVLVFRFREVT